MLGWTIGFFVAALVAAVFGFGGLASAFTGIAIILFWVFLALAVISLLFRSFGGTHAAGHGASGGAFATVALVAGVALLVYAWVDNDMSAERVGAEIDRTAITLAENTGEALSDAGDRAGTMMQNASAEIREDASQGLNEAADSFDSEEN